MKMDLNSKKFIVVSAITNCGNVLNVDKKSEIVDETTAIKIFNETKKHFKELAEEQNVQAGHDIYTIETDTSNEFTIYKYGTNIMTVKIIEFF